MAQVHPEPSASVTQVDTNTLKTNAEFDADIEYDPVLEGVQIQSPTEDREPFSIYELEQEKPEDYDVSDEDEETDQRPTSGSSQPNSEANDAGNERPTTQEASEEVRVLPMNGIKTDTAESNYLNSTKASECAIKGQTQNGDSKVFPENHFSLIFEQLSYFVKPGGFHMPWTQNRKYIFRNITAEIKSGELTAIMGPSGAGKSTLLDALSRRKVRNVTGNIMVSGGRSNVQIAYIPQHDFYFDMLTCEEALVIASKLKNATFSKTGDFLRHSVINAEELSTYKGKHKVSADALHRLLARSVLRLLGLEPQRKVRLGRLSGGQRKRMSIAQELVAKPDILLLDEPTSGLDSTASFQCIQMLHRLTQQPHPLAIICTIHQPNPATFAMFHHVLVLSMNGQFVFNGPADGLLDQLDSNGLPCPPYTSPADFVLQIASGEQGTAALVQMTDQSRINRPLINQFSRRTRPLGEMMTKPNYPNWTHFRLLFNRCFLLNLRDPMLTSTRLFSHIAMALFIGWLFGPNVGSYSNCPPRLGKSFDPFRFQSLSNETLEEVKGSMDNLSSIFFGLMIILFGAMLPTLVTFPLEMSIVLKEQGNGWYGPGSYFSARLLADTPFQLLIPFSYVALTYYLNGEPQDVWRFSQYSLIFLLTALISQCHGMIIGALLHDQITTAVYLGPISALPFFLMSGFLVRVQRMPPILRPFTNLSFMRFSFEGVILAIYGFNRCGDDAVEELVRMKSTILAWFTRIFNIVQNAGECDGDDLLGSVTQSNQSARLVWSAPEDPLSEVLLIQNRLQSALFNRTEKLPISSVSLRTGPEILGIERLQENPIARSMVDSIIGNMAGSLDSNGRIRPRVLEMFDLEDWMLNRALAALAIYFVVYRILSYIVIRRKSNQRD